MSDTRLKSNTFVQIKEQTTTGKSQSFHIKTGEVKQHQRKHPTLRFLSHQLSFLNKRQSWKYFVYNDLVHNNHTKFELNWIRTYPKNISTFSLTFSMALYSCGFERLKVGHGHWNWYESVKLKSSYYDLKVSRIRQIVSGENVKGVCYGRLPTENMSITSLKYMPNHKSILYLILFQHLWIP